MKKDTPPPYQDVLFIDSSNGTKFIIGSTFQSKEKEVFEGTEYPVCRLAVSSASHPFFTKTKKFIDFEKISSEQRAGAKKARETERNGKRKIN